MEKDILSDLDNAEMKEMMTQLLEQEKQMSAKSGTSALTGDEVFVDDTGVKKTLAELNLKTDAIAKIVVSQDHLQANMCVFEPQFDGADITMEDIEDAMRKEHVKFGVDYELLESIVEEKLYNTVFVIAKGVPAKDGKDGSVTYKYEQVKKLIPKRLEDGSVDYRDLGLVVNIEKGATICEIVNETDGEAGTDVYGLPIVPRKGKAPYIPQGINTELTSDGTKLFALESGNLLFQNNKYIVETTFTITSDVCTATGNVNFMGDIVIRGSVFEGFEVNAGKSIVVNGMVNGAVLTAGGDIAVKNGVVGSNLMSKSGNVNVGFGENTAIKCKGNLTTTSLINCTVEIEGNLECTRTPGVIIGGEISVLGAFNCGTLGHKNYIPTVVSIGAVTSLAIEKTKLEETITTINEYINKINMSLDFLQEKKRKGLKLDAAKEEFISSAIRIKVQKTLEKKPLRQRIIEIEEIMSRSDSLIIKANRTIYPNVKINMNSFTLTTTQEYGHCSVTCDKNGINIK